MSRLFIFLAASVVSSFALGDVSDPIVTYAESYQGYATIAGTVAISDGSPVGITVTNSGISYSTVTDAAGRWGIVIRHLAVNFSVQAFDLKNASDQSHDVTKAIRPGGK